MKTVIVTGANGFLGSYVVNELYKMGYEIYAIVRNKESNIQNIAQKNVHIIYCDLFDIEQLADKIEKRGFECFYHLAWSGSFGVQRRNYVLQMNNAIASAKAVKVARLLECKRFVGAGSITQIMYADYLKRDNSIPDMVACYAIGKMAAENLCQCVATEQGIEFVWGYLANFYGPGDTTQNFINFLIESYTKGYTPELTDAEQEADFTYVSDVAMGVVLLGHKATPGCKYYVGYGHPRPLKEFILYVKSQINPNVNSGIGRKNFCGIGTDYNKLNILKLKNDTGFQPIITFESGIRYTLEWYMKGIKSPWIY